jgi:geranylgeranyl pyrophosphate synthase
MGPAFQIRDDLIDLTEGKGRGGVKGADIREGKASILYAHALSHSMPAEQEQLLEIMRLPREDVDDEDVAWVMGLYERCGSMALARETADGLIEQAQAAIASLPVEQQPAFRELINYMTERST